jgi:hypothetical protein
MLSRAAHLRGAARNKALAVSLLSQNEPDWAAVLAFYSALHLIDAYLAERNLRAGDHARRGNFIATTADLKPIHSQYRRLELRSRWVRYELQSLTTDDVEALLTRDLRQIEEHILRLLQ